MSSEKCFVPDCPKMPVVRSYPVWNRQLVHQARYCDEHGRDFLANYDGKDLVGKGPPKRCGEAGAFDIELLVCDDRRDVPCHIFLRETGGCRRLDCQIGIFEAAAIQRELEQLPTPRPLTHRSMVSVMESLGGRLENVLVDSLLPAQHIFTAKLNIHHTTKSLAVDVRISDAIVLALICNVSIFVSDGVLECLSETLA